MNCSARMASLAPVNPVVEQQGPVSEKLVISQPTVVVPTKAKRGKRRRFSVISVSAFVFLLLAAATIAALSVLQGSNLSTQGDAGSAESINTNDLLARALAANCKTAPTPITAMITGDITSGRYFAFGSDSSTGTFLMVQEGGMWHINADSSDDVTSTWGCPEDFTYQN